MQMSRLAGQGRISEFFGPKALNLDKFMLAMEFHELSKQSLEFLDTEEQALLNAYTSGVNDYIENISILGFDRHYTGFLLPPEFYIFGMTGDALQPFTAADVLT